MLVRAFLWLFFLALRDLFFSDAILFYKFVQSIKVAEDMDTTPSVQVSWLEKPQVIRVEVTEGHRVLLIGPLVKIEGLEFRYLS